MNSRRRDAAGNAGVSPAGQAASRRLLIAFAIWGLAIAISFAPALQKPAPPDQLPGYATQIGIDAHGPFRFFALLIVVTLLTPWLARPLARRLADAEPWASNATIAACVTAFWFVALERNPFYVIAPFAIAIAAFTLLRRVPMHFTRRDWILLPTFLTTLLAVIDVVKDIQVQRATLVAAAIVLAIRIAVTFLPSPLPPALAFLLAPLGLSLQTGFFARDQRYFGWHALLLVIVTPFVLRLLLRNERRAVKALAFVIYPIVVYAYTNAMSITTAEGKERLNFFEDSHSLPIASEYLRGEAPYRDNLPVHGLGADGGFEYLAFQLTGASAGGAMRARAVVATLNSIAIYALGAAMTGVAEVGLVAFFFATLTGSTSSMLRATPALFTLLLIVLAIRKRDSRYLVAAGIGTVLCGVQGLDFGLYALIVLLIAAFRMRAFRAAALGLGATAALLFIVFAIFGILDDFFRGTFGEILSMGPAYALNLFTPPRDLTTFPEFLPLAFRGDAFPYFVWCGIAIATAVLLARPRRRSREGFVIVGIWIVLCAISYAERHHLYFTDLIAPLAHRRRVPRDPQTRRVRTRARHRPAHRRDADHAHRHPRLGPPPARPGGKRMGRSARRPARPRSSHPRPRSRGPRGGEKVREPRPETRSRRGSTSRTARSSITSSTATTPRATSKSRTTKPRPRNAKSSPRSSETRRSALRSSHPAERPSTASPSNCAPRSCGSTSNNTSPPISRRGVWCFGGGGNIRLNDPRHVPYREASLRRARARRCHGHRCDAARARRARGCSR